MALASLCSDSIKSGSHHSSFLGFIVDHKLRQGSTEEAHHVAAELRRLSIDSDILTLDWSPHNDPAPLAHLESSARQLRYQALGTACYKHGINTLLVAHHADDQAETAMLRMLKKYFGSGLRGIKAEKPIAKCQGMYGVHASGTPRLPPAKHEEKESPRAPQILIECGGVAIVRPLLGSTKQDLITYCQEKKVNWVEDATNADPTFTTRNTVRYLQNNDLLPTALRKQSLLQVAAKAADRETQAEQIANREFARMSINLDLRTGSATISRPAQIESDKATLDGMDGPSAALNLRARLCLLRKLLAFIAPNEEISLPNLYGAVDLVFVPPLAPQIDRSSLRTGETMQIAGVNIRPEANGANQPRYTLSRQVPTWQDLATRRTVLSETLRPRKTTGRESLASDWHLWDNRYWTRYGFSHPSPAAPEQAEVVVRFLTPALLGSLRETLKWPQRKRLEDCLLHVPRDVRWTLPALVVLASPTAEEETSVEEQVVALPSLGWSVEGWQRWQFPENSADAEMAPQRFWDIRYRKIEFGEGESHTVAANLLSDEVT